jgi:hypothetical protein
MTPIRMPDPNLHTSDPTAAASQERGGHQQAAVENEFANRLGVNASSAQPIAGLPNHRVGVDTTLGVPDRPQTPLPTYENIGAAPPRHRPPLPVGQ